MAAYSLNKGDLMHVTSNLAGLIAQVYPTLLLAILIEGRLRSIEHVPLSRRSRFFPITRLIAMMGGLLSTWLCLYAAGAPDADGVVLDWVVSASGGAMLLYLGCMAANVLYVDHGDASRPSHHSDNEKQRRL